MSEIRVRSISPFHHRKFLRRVFDEMCEQPLPDGEFPIGRSLSWRGFRALASREDLARICTNALDRREPHVRPDRRLYASFRLSLGIHLLDSDLPFTGPQLEILRQSAQMQRRMCHLGYPVERIEDLIQQRETARYRAYNA